MHDVEISHRKRRGLFLRKAKKEMKDKSDESSSNGEGGVGQGDVMVGGDAKREEEKESRKESDDRDDIGESAPEGDGQIEERERESPSSDPLHIRPFGEKESKQGEDTPVPSASRDSSM